MAAYYRAGSPRYVYVRIFVADPVVNDFGVLADEILHIDLVRLPKDPLSFTLTALMNTCAHLIARSGNPHDGAFRCHAVPVVGKEQILVAASAAKV